MLQVGEDLLQHVLHPAWIVFMVLALRGSHAAGEGLWVDGGCGYVGVVAAETSVFITAL